MLIQNGISGSSQKSLSKADLPYIADYGAKRPPNMEQMKPPDFEPFQSIETDFPATEELVIIEQAGPNEPALATRVLKEMPRNRVTPFFRFPFFLLRISTWSESDVIYEIFDVLFRQEVLMATASAPKPDLTAHRESLHLPISEITSRLVNLIGRKLTAYVGGVRDVRAVDRWMVGRELYGQAEPRLRFAYQVVKMLSEHEESKVMQAWLIGSNPELGDRVPLRLMREGDIEVVAPEVMGAARAFLVGG